MASERNQSNPGRTRKEYIARINRVIDYIQTHLDQDLTLQTLSTIAYFSPYQLHRIFSAMMGETMSQFIQWLRIERAASLLKSSPERRALFRSLSQ